MMKKILGFLSAIIVFALAGFVLRWILVGIFIVTILIGYDPDESAHADIEAFINIAAVLGAVFLGHKTYKKVSKSG